MSSGIKEPLFWQSDGPVVERSGDSGGGVVQLLASILG